MIREEYEFVAPLRREAARILAVHKAKGVAGSVVVEFVWRTKKPDPYHHTDTYPEGDVRKVDRLARLKDVTEMCDEAHIAMPSNAHLVAVLDVRDLIGPSAEYPKLVLWRSPFGTVGTTWVN